MKTLITFITLIITAPLFGCNTDDKNFLDRMLNALNPELLKSLYQQIDAGSEIWVENDAYKKCRELWRTQSDDPHTCAIEDDYDRISDIKEQQLNTYKPDSININNKAITNWMFVSVKGNNRSIKTDATIAYLLTQKSNYIS